MAKYRESLCRLCRAEGIKLFQKGDRCFTEKCALDRRAYAPGEHGQSRRGKHSDYGVQMREKQKLKRMFGLLERQFRNYFHKADKQKGVTGSNLLLMLERRLDNVVFRLGFANSRAEARQLVLHGHFFVSGKKVNIPSYLVGAGEEIQVREKSRNITRILESMDIVARRGLPQWLELDKDNFKGTFKRIPARDELTMPIQEQLVVELYSK
ncbi:MAG: 30S ribosomal protein S4 [Syntrophaceae bacterium]